MVRGVVRARSSRLELVAIPQVIGHKKGPWPRCMRPATGSTAGSPSRSTRAWPTTRTDDPAGHRTVEDRRPAQPAHQDRGDAGRTARDHCGDRRGYLGERHPDLLRRTPPRRHGRLPRRPAGGHGLGPRPIPNPLRRVVLRIEGGHRDRCLIKKAAHQRQWPTAWRPLNRLPGLRRLPSACSPSKWPFPSGVERGAGQHARMPSKREHRPQGR